MLFREKRATAFDGGPVGGGGPVLSSAQRAPPCRQHRQVDALEASHDPLRSAVTDALAGVRTHRKVPARPRRSTWTRICSNTGSGRSASKRSGTVIDPSQTTNDTTAAAGARSAAENDFVPAD